MDMIIGKHLETLTWEVSPLLNIILGDLPISYLRQYNPYIHWKFEIMQWWNNNCKKHCLPTGIMLTGITIEEPLLEDSSSLFQVSAAIDHDEPGDEISLLLP